MAHVHSHTTVVRDGWHNAFTDLIFWDGCYWISYRKGAGHVSRDGEACLAVSTDRQRFREVAHLKMPGDTRDPKLLATTDGRLAMYFPSWIGGHKARHLQQFVAFSRDGFRWETPQPVYAPHWWLWRIVGHGGRYYSAAYTYAEATPEAPHVRRVQLLVSDDLLQWESVSRIAGVDGGESALHFSEDGTLRMVTRGQGPALFSVSHPPYTQWETTPLNAAIHAPVVLPHEGKLFVAGRRFLAPDDPTYAFHFADGDAYHAASLGIWEWEENRITPVLHIPASGDCSYPGLTKDDEGRICLSYYSQHAYRMGVCPNHGLPASDVYFAELKLS